MIVNHVNLGQFTPNTMYICNPRQLWDDGQEEIITVILLCFYKLMLMHYYDLDSHSDYNTEESGDLKQII